MVDCSDASICHNSNAVIPIKNEVRSLQEISPLALNLQDFTASEAGRACVEDLPLQASEQSDSRTFFLVTLP